MDAFDALFIKIDHNRAGIIAAGNNKPVYTELLHAVFDAFIFLRVFDLLYLHAGMTSFGACEIGVDLINTLRGKRGQCFHINKVIKPRVAVWDHIRGDAEVIGHLGGALDNTVQSAAISAGG